MADRTAKPGGIAKDRKSGNTKERKSGENRGKKTRGADGEWGRTGA